jgi:hypothetical protein
MTPNPEIAATILRQLPRTAFAMMGARDLLDIGNGIQFKPGANAHKITAIRIVLEPSDTYTIEIYKGRGLSMYPAKPISGVYADGLARALETATGLYLSL